MEVGVSGAAGGLMVAPVIEAATAPGQQGVEGQNQLAQPIIGPGLSRQQGAVHGVVADDEQAALHQSAQQHRQHQGRRRPGLQVTGQKPNKRGGPHEEDRQGEGQAKTGAQERCGQGLPGSHHQRRNWSSSAGDANRSMATK